jgi:hypothetical protein
MVTATRAARCGWKKADGGPCGAFASKVSGLCSRHDPAKLQEPRALVPARRGNARVDPRSIRLAMGRVLEDVLTGRLSPNAAKAAVSAANAWLGAYGVQELERELDELRAIADLHPAGEMPAYAGPMTEDDFREEQEEDSPWTRDR